MDPRLIALGLTGDPAAPSAPPELNLPDAKALDSGTATRIPEAVARLRDETEQQLSRLIRIPSTSPNYPGQDFEALVGGESRCAEFLAEIYLAGGAEVEIFGRVQGRDNAVGRIRGAGGGRSLIYNGHTDVVPPGPQEDWSDDPWVAASPRAVPGAAVPRT